MMASAGEAQPRGSVDFVESSVLEALVPADTDVDLEDEIASWDGHIEDEQSSVIPTITPRHTLFFDELVPVYIVLRTPPIEVTTFKSYLSRLAINLEAFAFSTAPNPDPEAKATPSKELIYGGTIQDSQEPVIIRHEEQNHPHIYVVWKTEVFISRPRGRFYKPAVYFQPAASLKPAERAKKDVTEDEYLPSRVPTALNLLQSFEHDPALAGIHPRLSALRISKIAPTAPVAKELVRPIRSGQRRLFRVAPAMSWRVRYSRIQSSLHNVSLMASLDIEVAYITGSSVSIGDIDLSLSGGNVEAITTQLGSLVAYKPGDQITYLYRLTPHLTADGSPILGPDGHILDLKMKAKALFSGDCQPNLAIEWRTAVDFTTEHNSSLVKAAHRLSSSTLQPPAKSPNPDSLPDDEHSEQGDEPQSTAINVTLTISGPPQVSIGSTFNWDVFIVNRSDKARKLAVLVLPKRKRDYERHKSHSSTSSAGGQRGEKKDLIASAVIDENIVYAKQKSARLEPAELLCLTTDVRVGHLAPGACYTADLKFLALSAGVLSVDALRIVDLATNEVADVRDLPSIIAVE